MKLSAFLNTRIRKFQKTGTIYILPTREGGYFLGGLFFLFLVSMAYGNYLAIWGTFYFLGLIQYNAWEAHRNLKQAKLFFRSIRHHRAGEKTQVEVSIGGKLLENIASGKIIFQRIVTDDIIQFELSEIQERPGIYKPGKIKISYLGPNRLFKPWVYINIGSELYVFPKAIDHLKNTSRFAKDLNRGEEFHQTSKIPGIEYDFQNKVKILVPSCKINWKKSIPEYGQYWVKNNLSSTRPIVTILESEIDLPPLQKAEQISFWVKKVIAQKQQPLLLGSAGAIKGEEEILRYLTGKYFHEIPRRVQE